MALSFLLVAEDEYNFAKMGTCLPQQAKVLPDGCAILRGNCLDMGAFLGFEWVLQKSEKAKQEV